MDQINRAKSLLSQALGAVANAMPNDNSVGEVKGHIKKAIQKIETAQQSQLRKQSQKETQHQKWWGEITAGVGKAPISQKAAMKTIQELNKLIGLEQFKIEDIDKKIDGQSKLLND